MTRVAAIDVGTNSVKLAIADVAGDVDLIREDSQITRLGQGVDETGSLRGDAMERTLTVVQRFAEQALSAGAISTAIVGTSALRDARNGADFIAGVTARTGLVLEIISGDREAQLAQTAVSSDPALDLDPAARLVVFDIGGGSTEVTIGRGSKVDFHGSFNIGAVRLTERTLPSDPPGAAELCAAMDQVAAIFDKLEAPAGPLAGVGIGGTVVNAAAVAAGGREGIHGTNLLAQQIAHVLDRLAAVPVEIRRGVPGLEPARADVIVAGVVILASLMTKLNLPNVRVSTRGLRYGLLVEMANKINNGKGSV